MWTRAALTGAASILTTQAALAGPPVLYWPLECTLGQTCYIEDYVDTDPGSGTSDFTCGIKSRDGHRGTDIVVQSFEAMQDGINVLAAAPGRVAATRDGLPDHAITPETRADIEGKECGNAVRVDHGDGWQTLYCHMKSGSLNVAKGDQVQTGTPLGQVGLSGLTNIPHLHISVLKDGKVIDPFFPEANDTCSTESHYNGLWSKAPPYHRSGLFTAGFSTKVPEFEDVKSGAARAGTAPPDAPMVLYGHVFYAETGDILEFRATGPKGEVFQQDIPLENPQAQLFRAFGRKAPPEGWPEGEYRGTIRLMRDQTLIAWRHADLEITSR